jgi:hypothetical protein
MTPGKQAFVGAGAPPVQKPLCSALNALVSRSAIFRHFRGGGLTGLDREGERSLTLSSPSEIILIYLLAVVKHNCTHAPTANPEK